MEDSSNQSELNVTPYSDEKKLIFQRRPRRRARAGNKFYGLNSTPPRISIPPNNSKDVKINPAEMPELTVEVVSGHGCSVDLNARFGSIERLSSQWLKQLRSRILYNHNHLSLFRARIIGDGRKVSSGYGEGMRTFQDFEKLCQCTTEPDDTPYDPQLHCISMISLHERFTQQREITGVDQLTLMDEKKGQ